MSLAEMQRIAGELSVMFARRPARLHALLALSGLLLAACNAADPESGTTRRATREIDAVMASVAATELRNDPERASQLGLAEAETKFAHNALLAERSQAAFERQRLVRFETLEALRRAPMPGEAARYGQNLRVLLSVYDDTVTLAADGHGLARPGEYYPYAADHLRGAYADVPDLLLRTHAVNKPADAEDYIRRLQLLPDRLDDEARRLAADAQAGIAPPRIVIERMKTRVARIGAGPAETHALLVMFDRLSQGVEGQSAADRDRLKARALETLKDEILPAYARLFAVLEQIRPLGADEPGVWQLPNGDAYYERLLAALTGSRETPERLHAQGHSEVEALTAELDAALIAAGFASGTVAERLAELARQPGQIRPATPLGAGELLMRLDAEAVRANALAARVLTNAPTRGVTIEASPAYVDAPGPDARYLPARADKRAPALLQIPLGDLSNWPDYALATLVHREVLPGRHMAVAYAEAEADLPLARRLIPAYGFSEGWAAYAASLADEMDLNKDAPLAHIGYLRARLIDAATLVSDTGIHRMRWTRAQAIDYLTSVTGQPSAWIESQVDRQSAEPATATAAAIGRKKMIDLRERAMRVMGPKFDLRAFHDVVLSTGPRPLDLVENDVERWYSEAAKAAK